MKQHFYFDLIRYICSAFAVGAFLLACSGESSSSKNKEQDLNKTDTIPVVYRKPPSSFNDTFIIYLRAAVFYNPDSLQLEKIKKNTPKNIFESNVHDCFYQMRNAQIVLKKYWPQIHIIETSRARYLLFIKSDNNKIHIDLNTKGDMCGIFLFDRKKEPELIDMMNIDTALGFYFGK